jgi:hypothetical protein
LGGSRLEQTFVLAPSIASGLSLCSGDMTAYSLTCIQRNVSRFSLANPKESVQWFVVSSLIGHCDQHVWPYD